MNNSKRMQCDRRLALGRGWLWRGEPRCVHRHLSDTAPSIVNWLVLLRYRAPRHRAHSRRSDVAVGCIGGEGGGFSTKGRHPRWHGASRRWTEPPGTRPLGEVRTSCRYGYARAWARPVRHSRVLLPWTWRRGWSCTREGAGAHGRLRAHVWLPWMERFITKPPPELPSSAPSPPLWVTKVLRAVYPPVLAVGGEIDERIRSATVRIGDVEAPATNLVSTSGRHCWFARPPKSTRYWSSRTGCSVVPTQDRSSSRRSTRR